MRHAWIMVLIALSGAPAVAQVAPGPTVITPPRPMATIEFVAEAGVERWEVNLTGEKLPAGRAHLRITGSSCTQMDQVYRGMITPLYEDMTFKTKNGRTCTVQAIER